MTREEIIEYITREAKVAAEQMLDKSQPIHLFDFGIFRPKYGPGSLSCMIVLGKTELLEEWAKLTGMNRC